MRALASRSLPSRSSLALLASAGALSVAMMPRAAHAATTSTAEVKDLSLEVNKGLPTSIDTGTVGPSQVQVQAFLAIDPVKSNPPEPLMKVVMNSRGATLQASWGPAEKGRIKVKAIKGSNDANMRIRYTLSPLVKVTINLTSPVTFNTSLQWDAKDIVNKLPGAMFNYDVTASAPFSTWGFAPGVDVKSPQPSLDSSKLFGIPFQNISTAIADLVKGDIAIYLTTAPTFSYKTTKIGLAGADNVISTQDAEIGVPSQHGDYLEVQSTVEGILDIKGDLQIKPAVTIDEVFAFGKWNTVNQTFGFSVLTTPYTTTGLKVNFPAKTVHFPLPNVQRPDDTDIGSAKTGKEVEKIIKVQNTGELASEMEFSSSDPAFIVPSGKVLVEAKASYDLKIVFRPTADGAKTADITVRSDDPDEPEQTFKVGANGANVGKGGGTSGTTDPAATANNPSGCGCHTTRESFSTAAGSALLGLGVVALLRRRRR